jgi:hypothetical protein
MLSSIILERKLLFSLQAMQPLWLGHDMNATRSPHNVAKGQQKLHHRLCLTNLNLGHYYDNCSKFLLVTSQ